MIFSLPLPTSPGVLCHSLSATNLPKQRTTASVSFVEISCHETDCDSLTLVDFFSKTLPSSTKKLCSKEGRVLANGPSFETIEKKSGKSMSLAFGQRKYQPTSEDSVLALFVGWYFTWTFLRFAQSAREGAKRFTISFISLGFGQRNDETFVSDSWTSFSFLWSKSRDKGFRKWSAAIGRGRAQASQGIM